MVVHPAIQLEIARQRRRDLLADTERLRVAAASTASERRRRRAAGKAE
jgi:hypothetical protein